MANIDVKWEFSDGESISADAYSENLVDLGSLGVTYRQIGQLYLNVVLTTAFTSCTSIDVILRSGTGVDGDPGEINAGIISHLSTLTLSSDRSLATTAGDGLVLMSAAIPLTVVQRYVQVYYDVDTPSGTAVIDAWAGLSPINEQLNIQEEPS